MPRGTLSISSGSAEQPAPLGRPEPRLWTPPLRDLGTPEHPNHEATYGWDVIAFATDVLDAPLDPWQAWLVVHAGELLPDGRPRFREVLALVGRQQGKTHLLQVLALYWLFVERQGLVLGMSTNLAYAREAWEGAVQRAKSVPWLAELIGNVRLVNGEQTLTTATGERYKIAASNAEGGRGLSIDRLIMDELRQHKKWDAYMAATPAMNARPNAQAWYITNQGEDHSVVLNSLRAAALEHLGSGNGDDRLALFEWSAPEDAAPDELEALAQACPNLGHRTDGAVLVGQARRAMAAGGEELAKFRTEILCQRVHMLNPAIEPAAWTAAGVEPADALQLATHRDRLALCVDVSLDGDHAAVLAAALVDGLVHVEVVGSWSGFGCAQAVREALPALVARVRPRVLGWLPDGPAAVLAADLGRRAQDRSWPPRGVDLVEIRAEKAAICMGLAEQVRTGAVRHPRDPMLDVHVASASKLRRGDAWVFQRQGTGPIDGAYALAGAVHLARTAKPRPRLAAY